MKENENKVQSEKFHFKYTNAPRKLTVLSLEYSPVLNMYVVNYYDQQHCFDSLVEAQEEMAECVKRLCWL